ncbi:MAG: MBL fold metallo-hydrolase, partial [Acidobacteria bacterium]|nr:MBL fold metallo-hydrolase [Acidobacteriota bacterium]
AREASVTRAVFAAAVFLAARAADHRTEPLNTLALAAGCLVAADPRSLVDPGFQLSFGATAGLLVGVPRLMRWVDRGEAPPRPGRPADRAPPAPAVRFLLVPAAGLLVATVCAELALFPIGALHFSRVTVAGLGLNFAAIPLMSVTQLAGMAAVGLAPVSAAAAEAAGWVAHAAAAGIVESTRVLAWAPWLSWRLPAPGPVAVAVYYAGWVIGLAADHGRRRRPAGASPARTVPDAGGFGNRVGAARWVGAALVLASAAAMLAAPIPGLAGRGAADACEPLPPATAGAKRLRVDFLDVDQADATLVRFPDGRSLLVDAAGQARGRADVGGRVVVPAVWALGVRRLDYLAITHGHPDHVGGAAAVLRDLRPREVWEGIPVPSSEPLAALRSGARTAGAAWRNVHAGHVERIGGVRVRALHPPAPDWERPRVRNDDSLVLDLRYGEVSIVLPGDIEAGVEAAVAAALDPAGRRVVKAPHHGSRSSSSATFVKALSPVLAVVSAGRDHAFRHPHREVVARYAAAGAVVLATGNEGAIAICTDGRGLAVSTHDGRRIAW